MPKSWRELRAASCELRAASSLSPPPPSPSPLSPSPSFSLSYRYIPFSLQLFLRSPCVSLRTLFFRGVSFLLVEFSSHRMSPEVIYCRLTGSGSKPNSLAILARLNGFFYLPLSLFLPLSLSFSRVLSISFFFFLFRFYLPSHFFRIIFIFPPTLKVPRHYRRPFFLRCSDSQPLSVRAVFDGCFLVFPPVFFVFFFFFSLIYFLVFSLVIVILSRDPLPHFFLIFNKHLPLYCMCALKKYHASRTIKYISCMYLSPSFVHQF